MSRRALRHTRALAALALTFSLGAATAPVRGEAVPQAQPGTASPAYRTFEVADTHGSAHDPARLDRAASITASVPESVETGSTVVVSGVVRVASRRRVVVLVEWTGSEWRRVARKRSTRTGSFRFAVPAGTTARTRTFQVRAPRARTLAAARTDRLPVRVTSTAPPAPQEPTTSGEAAPVGQPDDWSFLFANGGSRWNPCTTIRWAYNPQGSYDGSLSHVQESFTRIAARTGLAFEYVGETSHVHKTGTAFPTNADIAVGWADAASVPDLAGGVVGIGGGRARSTSGKDVAWQLVEGYVVLDREHALRPGFDTSGSTTWGQVMQHEVLHALGLGHAQGAEQVMHGSVSSLNHRFGAGDLTGMHRVGADPGCL